METNTNSINHFTIINENLTSYGKVISILYKSHLMTHDEYFAKLNFINDCRRIGIKQKTRSK